MPDPVDLHGRNKDLDGNQRVRHGSVDIGACALRLQRGMIFSVE